MHKRDTIITVATLSIITLLATLFWGPIQTAQAHCQVPCGIYNDAARIAALNEDTETIAKCITKINALAGKTDATSINQTVRWIQTKETHASHIITVVSEYFLTQKVKAVGSDNKQGHQKYLESLARHHAVMVAAMKTKQNPSLKAVQTLNSAIHLLSHDYVQHQH